MALTLALISIGLSLVSAAFAITAIVMASKIGK